MASDVPNAEYVEFISGVDGMIVLAQAKMAYQKYSGDHAGAEATSKRFWTFSLGASQLASVQDVYHGNFEQARLRQRQFLDSATRMLRAMPEAVPVLGHMVGGVHCCVGNREHGKQVLKRASRSCFVCAPGLLIGGASIALGIPAQTFAQTAVMTAAAGVGGVVAGMQADVRLYLGAIPPQVGSSPGERFDFFVVRLLDAMKSVCCMDLVPILYPDSIEQASVWVEPLNAQEAAHLIGIKNVPGLEQIDTGALHSFVVLKTTKGHILLTERLHDGQIILGDATAPTVQHFADGNAFSMTDSSYTVSPMAMRLEMARENGATLFAVKEIAGGPSAAAFIHFAKAQSTIGYDLITSNCQHYANSVLEFASGKGLTFLPNGNLLELSAMLMPPTATAPFVTPGLFSTMAYEASQASGRAAMDAAVICCPRPIPALPEPEQLQQLPLDELQRQLEQMTLQQREMLTPAQLQQLAGAASAQVANGREQMQGHRLDGSIPTEPAPQPAAPVAEPPAPVPEGGPGGQLHNFRQ